MLKEPITRARVLEFPIVQCNLEAKLLKIPEKVSILCTTYDVACARSTELNMMRDQDDCSPCDQRSFEAFIKDMASGVRIHSTK